MNCTGIFGFQTDLTEITGLCLSISLLFFMFANNVFHVVKKNHIPFDDKTMTVLLNEK